MNEILAVGSLSFAIQRSAHRRTLGLTVGRAGTLVIHAPQSMASDELERWTRKKLVWVHRKLALKEEASPKVRGPEYVSGETFMYLGRRYRLTLVDQQREPLHFDGTTFRLRRDARPAEPLFRRWYIAVGHEWLQERAKILAKRTGTTATRVEVRDLGFRWGSCGKNGVLFFDWKVLQLPVRLVDYVITHELVHLAYPHHQPAFRQALERALPDWQERKEAIEHRAKEYLVFGLAVPSD
jgi:predicted metal-dependent hydrolase